MDDKFLYQLREQPDPEFARKLHQQLFSHHSKPRRRRRMPFRTFIINNKTKLAWSLAIMAVVFVVAMTISPVRAFVLAYPIEIAGRIFEVSDVYPEDDTNVTIIEAQTLSLDEALAVFPYTVKLPSNIPPEYVLDEENVRVYLGIENWPEMIHLTWKGEGKGLSLVICGNCDWERGKIVAPDAVEEVLLDDQHPAVLTQGGWYQNEKAWNYDIALTLEWQVDDVLYELSTGAMPPEQLIEIATSTIK